MGSETTKTGLDSAAPRTSSTGLERADILKPLERGERGRLLPLLPDEITTTLIIPRLSRRAIINSSQLNCAWRAALRSPMRAQASQTIVNIRQFDCIISLYDPATRTWHRSLPRVPLNSTSAWGCVTLQGKLYILEGNEDLGGKLHVFDEAGRGQWKECASMKHASRDFSCQAFDGKIYIFGGAGPANTAEVYDPEQDLWSDQAPMLSRRPEHKVVMVGDVFSVHMGRFIEVHGARCDCPQFVEIYDPRTVNWTKVANFAIGDTSQEKAANVAEAGVVIGGRLHGSVDDWTGCMCMRSHSILKRGLDGTVLVPMIRSKAVSTKADRTISSDVFHPTHPSTNP